MSERLRISIALCTYNGSRFLAEQLESIRRQERPPDEVVIYDDASTDSTLELIREFALSALFPVRVHQSVENVGYSRNFLRSVALCYGDIIALSDQDDVWYPQKLRRLEEEFVAHPEASGVFSDGDLMDIHSATLPGTLWGSFSFDPDAQRKVAAGNALPVLLQRNVVTGMAFAFRSSWRDVLEDMPEGWPHDFWLALRIAADGHLLPCPERLVSYRVHSNQQIGVPITHSEKIAFLLHKGVKAYRDFSLHRNLREYSKDAAQYESLLTKAQQDPVLATAWWLPMAREKAEHMRRVALQLQSGRIHRQLSALRHWRSYRQYAPTGLSALLRDLLL